MATEQTVNIEIIIKELKCYLTDQELQDLGDRVARLVEKKQEVDEQKKMVAKQYGTEIAELDDEIYRVSRTIVKKTEIRPVECEIINNFDRKEMVIVRLDTMEPVESRAMTQKELQGKLWDEIVPDVEITDSENNDVSTGPGEVVERFPDGSGFTVAGDMAKDFVEDVRGEGGDE